MKRLTVPRPMRRLTAARVGSFGGFQKSFMIRMAMLAAFMAATAAAEVVPEARKPAGDSQVVVHPQPHDAHLRNPGMGFIFYSYGGRAEPPEQADVLFACMPVWAQVEQARGRYDFDIPQIKGVAVMAATHGRRWAIRIMPSAQRQKQPIPTWLVEAGVQLFPPDPKWLAHFKQEDLFEPEWWNPIYVKAHAAFVKAYGQKLDGAAGLEFVDMRYYGFWGEGHRFGSTVPWPQGVDKRKLMTTFIDDYLAAFKKTSLVVETARDQGEPYPEGTAIDYALARGCWMRRDGFGGYMSAEETRLIDDHWRRHPLVAENGAAYEDFLAGNVAGWTIDRVVDEMLAHHVSYFPMGWGVGDWDALVVQRPDIVKKVSLRVGYRFEVTKASWPRGVKPGESFAVEAVWRNTAVACLPFHWHPTAYLLSPDHEQPVARVVDAKADPRGWIDGKSEMVRFNVSVPADTKPGRYAVAVAITDDHGQPAIDLGIEGNDGQKRFVLGHVTVNAE